MDSDERNRGGQHEAGDERPEVDRQPEAREASREELPKQPSPADERTEKPNEQSPEQPRTADERTGRDVPRDPRCPRWETVTLQGGGAEALSASIRATHNGVRVHCRMPAGSRTALVSFQLEGSRDGCTWCSFWLGSLTVGQMSGLATLPKACTWVRVRVRLEGGASGWVTVSIALRFEAVEPQS